MPVTGHLSAGAKHAAASYRFSSTGAMAFKLVRPSGRSLRGRGLASLCWPASGLVAVALTLYRDPPRSRDLADYKAELRSAVRHQWRAEEVRRRLHDPMPIPVRWQVASPSLGVQDHWANVALGRDQGNAMAV